MTKLSRSLLRVLLVALTLSFVFAASPTFAQGASGRDAEFKAWQGLFAKRSESLKDHKAAMLKIRELADKYTDDYEIQWQCSRAFYYFSERYQKEREDLIRAAKMSKIGTLCGKRAKKANPKGFDGAYWHLANHVRVVAAESQVKALRMAKEVRAKLDKLIAAHPKRVEAQMMLGGLYRVVPGFPVSFGDPKKSLDMLLAAEKIGPGYAELVIEIAETYVVLGDTAKAKAYYQKTLTAPGYESMDFELKDARTYAKKRIKELSE